MKLVDTIWNFIISKSKILHAIFFSSIKSTKTHYIISYNQLILRINHSFVFFDPMNEYGIFHAVRDRSRMKKTGKNSGSQMPVPRGRATVSITVNSRFESCGYRHYIMKKAEL